MRAARAALCAMGLALPLASPAGAVPIPFDFIATATGITDPGGVLDGSGLVVGGSFSGSYTVDSDAVDMEPSPILGRYDGGVLTATLQLGSALMVLDSATAPTNFFWVVDQWDSGGPFADGYAPEILGASGVLDGSPLSGGQLAAFLASSDTSIFSSDALHPAMPGNLAGDFDVWNQVIVSGNVGGNVFQIDGFISSIIVVPEPSTGMMLALGLAMLTAAGRRRRS